MPRIFISYRREDSSGYTGRLYDHLSNHFGKERIFRDIEDIEYGVEYVPVIENELDSCGVVIVVIGTRWLTVDDKQGQRRVDDPNDLHRLEIETALNRKIRVIPALVAGARMPKRQELPDSLAKLGRRNALEISDTRFEHDVRRLVEQLEGILGPARPKRAKGDRKQRRSRAPEAPAPPRLAQVLPGTWQAQITYLNGMIGQAFVEMYPNGGFRTQGASFIIEGMWQVIQPNQIFLSGQQSDGFQVTPFNATIHFSQITPNTLVGTMGSGEQLVYQRVR